MSKRLSTDTRPPAEGDAEPEPTQRLISLGRLVNVHATRGEVRLLPHNPDSTTLQPGMTVLLQRNGTATPRKLTALRRHKSFLLLTFEGCTSMNEAQLLVGNDVCIDQAELPPAGPNEIYHYQLIGMQVVTDSGESLGRITEVMTPPANDVLIVRHGAREYLIPMIEQVILDIDVEAQRVTIHPIPGLLDE